MKFQCLQKVLSFVVSARDSRNVLLEIQTVSQLVGGSSQMPNIDPRVCFFPANNEIQTLLLTGVTDIGHGGTVSASSFANHF